MNALGIKTVKSSTLQFTSDDILCVLYCFSSHPSVVMSNCNYVYALLGKTYCFRSVRPSQKIVRATAHTFTRVFLKTITRHACLLPMNIHTLLRHFDRFIFEGFIVPLFSYKINHQKVCMRNSILKENETNWWFGVIQNLELIKKIKYDFFNEILQGLVLKHVYILLILNFPLNHLR